MSTPADTRVSLIELLVVKCDEEAVENVNGKRKRTMYAKRRIKDSHGNERIQFCL